jgi:hypothetical protein
MSEVFNIYCDESCHLEHDPHKVMVLGAVWCPAEKAREIAVRIREIKATHRLPSRFEIKWTKVSPAKTRFYRDVVDYFFDDDDLHFRAVVIADKTQLRHQDFGQNHDTWYYKMLFQLLAPLLSPQNQFRIYLDIKDTRSAAKIRKLHEVLSNKMYDFDRRIIHWIQAIRSSDVEQLQLADLLIGAVGYANRGLSDNAGKRELVERLRQRSRYSLTRRTLLREQKVNLFVWRPQERSE